MNIPYDGSSLYWDSLILVLSGTIFYCIVLLPWNTKKVY